ncbi:ABC transporter family substrate-binding protein [Actinopolyspora mortivallis]|uniref:Peptide ABC transporter substrate-binding protein n=1 Tax=Actinopolyspora mortivallis TaxID=33906 RepID=A0A2T0H0I9_ACTMO|nr:ABC transporter family substrate-binding protein [Actinopolyspora mortivallis]PRW64850.1 peptide ABC transporter substrate-binding protein [Actinopolyspora mortivallis]
MYRSRFRPFPAAALVLVFLSVLTGCTNAPPPPVVSSTTPRPSSEPPTEPPQPRVVVAGVEKLEGGFNPHALADQSQLTDALSELMLPSVFVPGPDGEQVLNTTLMKSAEVVPDTDRFTVRYRIRTDAGWSDGAPIAAEDFVYLWEQMRSQDGVVNPVGYRMISDVRSQQGGKTVLVTFDRPYPGWKSLFDHLLPAHLVKDAPGGWEDTLDDGYPASGGPFAIRQFDLDRGQIVLMRNERYWAEPAKSDRIVVRAADRQANLNALSSGNVQLGMFDPDAETMRALRGLGEDVRLITLPRPLVSTLFLRRSSPQLNDVRVRRAVLAALDRNALVSTGTGGGPDEERRAHAQVLAPSQPGYSATEPAGEFSDSPDPQRVRKLLREAGYEHTDGSWVRDGTPLNLVIAAQFEEDSYEAVANAAADQLAAQDIGATVITPEGDELYRTMLPTDPGRMDPPESAGIDLAVAPRPVSADPASTLAAQWGCPSVDPDTGSTATFGPTGFCDRMLQPTIEAVTTGRIPFARASGRVEPVVWSSALALPLYQETRVLAVRRELRGVEDGPGFATPFSTVGEWIGAPGESYDW